MAWRAPLVSGAVIKIFNPATVIDVGCGVGDIVAELSRNGIKAAGLEGTSNAVEYFMCPKDWIIQHDLRFPLLLADQFDLVLCLEVAEHIEEEYVDIFVGNLQLLAKKWILVSAAPGEQKGTYHVNCQEQKYWIDKMEKTGFNHDAVYEEQVKEAWLPHHRKKGMNSYYCNSMVFRRAV